MGILQALFGSQMGQTGMNNGFTPVNQMPQTQVQQAPQTLGLVQDILSQRFQPQPQDIAQSIFMNGTGLGTNGGVTYPEAQSVNRLMPVMDIAKTLGTLNQSQLEIAKLNEMMRHDRATEGANPFAQPLTVGPGGMPTQSIPQTMQNAAPQQQNTSIPATMNRAADIFQGGSPDLPMPPVQATPMGSGPPNMSPAQAGALPGNQPPQPFMPVFKGNEVLPGAPPGYVWTANPAGGVMADIPPGAAIKGEGNELITKDAKGNFVQSIPQNPQAKAKFELNIQQIFKKFDELKAAGGSVEEGGGIIDNKINQAIADIPGGQTLVQGSKAQTIRDEIQSLIKQTTPLYMQAMGITPGMERAVSAQQMLQAALGGALGKTRQENMYSLGNLSRQAGTGDLAQKLDTQNAALQDAQDAIKAGAPRDAVMQRLQKMGVSTDGM